ncbi:MAG: hypothetical protein ACK4YV_14740 [Emticicia sp.]
MYFLYLAIAILAFIFNIFIVTNSPAGGQVGIAPVIQLVFIIPIFIICSLVYYFTKSTNFGSNYQHFYILLPFLLEITYFAFTKDLFDIFKADSFVTRSYVLSIGLATIAVFCLNWLYLKIF